MTMGNTVDPTSSTAHSKSCSAEPVSAWVDSELWTHSTVTDLAMLFWGGLWKFLELQALSTKSFVSCCGSLEGRILRDVG